MPGTFEKQIWSSQVPVEEAQVQSLIRWRGVSAHGQPQSKIGRPFGASFLRQEESQVVNRKSLKQPFADRVEHRIQVCFRAELPREFHQRAPVVIAVLVEILVQP